MARIVKTDTCWLWTGARNNMGYGVMSVAGLATYAHRFSIENFTGPIGDGLEVDHLCNVRHCVNPAHLEAVTPAENMRRRSERQTHCLRGHKRGGNTYPGGHCKTCMSQEARRRYVERKLAAASP